MNTKDLDMRINYYKDKHSVLSEHIKQLTEQKHEVENQLIEVTAKFSWVNIYDRKLSLTLNLFIVNYKRFALIFCKIYLQNMK